MPERRKLEKTAQEKVPQTSQKFFCCRCGLAYSRQKGFFPVSHSPMYRGSGYLPICNDCIETMFENYIRVLGSDRAAMRRICMKLDLYWSDSIYDMVEKTVGTSSKVRNYIGKTNIIRYIDKTYDNTIDEEEQTGCGHDNAVSLLAQECNVSEETEETIDVPDEVVAFWGPGYTPSMYMELEQRRQYWMSEFPDGTEIDVGTKALIRQICNLEIDINRDRAAGKPIDKNVNSLNTLLGSAKLKPNQKTEDADGASDNTPFGVWIKRWEDKRPIPEPDKSLKDVDGLIKYVDVWFKGHLSKMLGIKNTNSKLYDEEIARMRVERPEYDDEDDEVFFNNAIGSQEDGVV